MFIRALTPTDAEYFQTLRLAGLQESPTSFGASFEDECDLPLARVAASLGPEAGRLVFGAFVVGRLVGVVGVGRESGRKESHRGFLRSMYVMPEWRARGVGRALVNEGLSALRDMPGLRDVVLAVTAGNEAAVALYRAAGFVAYGTVPEVLQVDGVFTTRSACG